MSAETTPGNDAVSLYDVDNPAPVIEPPRKRTNKTPQRARSNF